MVNCPNRCKVWAGLSPSVSTENDGRFVHLRVMIRCARVHQPTGYFCTPWRQPWTNIALSTNADCRCIFCGWVSVVFLIGGCICYIYRSSSNANGGTVWRGLSLFSLDGTLSFLILVGTRTLSFNFLYTILFDFLAV